MSQQTGQTGQTGHKPAGGAGRGQSRGLCVARAKAALQVRQASAEPAIPSEEIALASARAFSEALPCAQFTVFRRPAELGGYGFRRGGAPLGAGFEALAVVQDGRVTWRKGATL